MILEAVLKISTNWGSEQYGVGGITMVLIKTFSIVLVLINMYVVIAVHSVSNQSASRVIWNEMMHLQT